jgi:hypothetical protein
MVLPTITATPELISWSCNFLIKMEHIQPIRCAKDYPFHCESHHKRRRDKYTFVEIEKLIALSLTECRHLKIQNSGWYKVVVLRKMEIATLKELKRQITSSINEFLARKITEIKDMKINGWKLGNRPWICE